MEDITQLVEAWLTKQSGSDRVALIAALDELAVALRDESTRACYSNLTLPKNLFKVLNVATDSGDEELIRQVGRVAANFAIDSDPNRQLLVDSGYISSALKLPIDVPAIVASLHNLAIESHPAVLASLRDEENFSRLTSLAARCAESDRAQWAWRTLTYIYGNEPYPPLTERILDNLLIPLHLWPGEIDGTTLLLSAGIVEIISGQDNASEVFCSGNQLQTVLDFVQNAQPQVDDVDEDRSKIQEVEEDDEEEEEGKEEPGKALSQAKGALIKALVDLSTGIPNDHVFWQRIRSWLTLGNKDRDDLLDCALLSLGNRARTDESAIELLQDPSLLPTITNLLISSTPARTQHSLIGLLRNLSIPMTNKTILDQAGVISRLMDMGVWSKDRDMLGSIQGGAIGILKNLCRTLDNAEEFINHQSWIDNLLDLLERTEDPAIRLEGTRIFVNTIRTLSQAQKTPIPSDDKTISFLVKMFECEYPVLKNEAIIALTLLVNFTPVEERKRIASTISSMNLDLNMKDGGDTGNDNDNDRHMKENATILESSINRYIQ